MSYAEPKPKVAMDFQIHCKVTTARKSVVILCPNVSDLCAISFKFVVIFLAYLLKKLYLDFVELLFHSEVKIKAFLFAFLSFFSYLCKQIRNHEKRIQIRTCRCSRSEPKDIPAMAQAEPEQIVSFWREAYEPHASSKGGQMDLPAIWN